MRKFSQKFPGISNISTDAVDLPKCGKIYHNARDYPETNLQFHFYTPHRRDNQMILLSNFIKLILFRSSISV